MGIEGDFFRGNRFLTDNQVDMYGLARSSVHNKDHQ